MDQATQLRDAEALSTTLQELCGSDDGRKRICGYLARRMATHDRYDLCVRMFAGFGVAAMVYRLMPYRDYLRTEHWKATSQAAKVRAGFRCQLCNKKLPLETHHRTYENRGAELESDLTVLCDGCHKKHHAELPDPEPAPVGTKARAMDEQDEAFNKMSEAEQKACLEEMIARKRMQSGLQQTPLSSPDRLPIRKPKDISSAASS